MGSPGATFCTSATSCAIAGLVGALSVGAVWVNTMAPLAGATRFGAYSISLVNNPRNPAAVSDCCIPSTLDMLPTTNTTSGALPALLPSTSAATASESGVAGPPSAALPYTTFNAALVTPAVSADSSYWPVGVLSVTTATVRSADCAPNTLPICTGQALLVAPCGTRHPLNPKP